MLLAFILTMSWGVWMALICGLGVWIIWKFTTSSLFTSWPKTRSLFPVFVVVYLCTILVISYLGPAQSAEGPGQSNYGNNSRAEVFERGAYFLLDFPITGGGLNSFPGLYSQYMLGIPHFYFINSYNTFLDVAIEQGVFGGLAFLFIYLGAVWLIFWTLTVAQTQQIRFLSWLALFALIFTVIHGFFYDYLYNGNIIPMLLFPVGFSMIGILDTEKSGYKAFAFSLFQARISYRSMVITTVLGILVIFALNRDKIQSIWYSDLGAVKMS